MKKQEKKHKKKTGKEEDFSSEEKRALISYQNDKASGKNNSLLELLHIRHFIEILQKAGLGSIFDEKEISSQMERIRERRNWIAHPYNTSNENLPNFLNSLFLDVEDIKARISGTEQKKLYKAFLKISYQFQAGDQSFTIKAAQTNTELDTFLRENREAKWAYITAWNTGAKQHSEEENAHFHQELIRYLQENHPKSRFFEGQGVPADDNWQAETSLFIFKLERDQALKIGKRFNQQAILWGNVGEVAELQIISSPDS